MQVLYHHRLSQYPVLRLNTVFVGDNGGAIYKPGSGNNHPLKGGKYSDWEGG